MFAPEEHRGHVEDAPQLQARRRTPPPPERAHARGESDRPARGSPGKAGDQLLLLHYTGRKTGRAFRVPVGYHSLDGVPTVLTNSPWRRNFASGQDIEVTFRGARRPARATLVEDVDAVTDVYVALIDGLGWKAAQRRLGVKINVKRMSAREEIAEAVRESGLSLVRLNGLVGEENPEQGSRG